MKSLFLSIFFLFINLTTVSAEPDELLRIFIDDFSGGQNSYDLPSVIHPSQSVSCLNVELSRKGQLSMRKGVTLFAQDLSDTAWTGIGRFTLPNNDYLVAASGGSVIRSTSAASWVEVNAGSSLSIGYNTEFIQCDNFLAILNGVDYPAWYDGTTFYQGAEGTSSPPVVKYGAWFKNYLFVANGSTEKDWVWFSNNLEPTIFTATDVFKVNSGDGQEVIALKPFKNNELIIYKERSVWVLDLTGSTPLTNWTLQPILKDIGLAAPRTVVNISNDQWFLSSEPIAVRSLARTEFDKIKTGLISKNIQDIFDGSGDEVINRTHINKAAAIFYDNQYLLSLPTDNSVINNTVLVFDLITNAWYLIKGWYVEDWKEFDNKLYFIDSTDGRVLQAFYGNFDQVSGPVVTNTDATGTTVRPIVFHYESKAYNFDVPELYKLLTGLEVTADTTGDHDLKVYINLDGGGWQYVGAMNLSGTATSLPEDLPFTIYSNKQVRYMFPLQKYGEAREIQIGFDKSVSDETVELRSYSIFGKTRKWRME